MGTLNPSLLSPEMDKALNAAAQLRRRFGKDVLTPEILLYLFLSNQEFGAARLIQRLVTERGFKLDEFTRTVQTMAEMRDGRNANLDFAASDGRPVPLSDETIVVLDEGHAVAQAAGEIYVSTEHALAAMSQRGVTTSGVLQRFGVTPTALTDILASQAISRRYTSQDWVAQARAGELAPVYRREDLLRELLSLLALSQNRHILLVGPPGVGKRSLIQSLALLMAEGGGPPGLTSLIAVLETALLDDAGKAVQAAARQAEKGILFLPNVHRFLGGALDVEYPKATTPVRRAFLDEQSVLVATTTMPDYQARIARDPLITERSTVLAVAEPALPETITILGLHKPRIEQEYQIKVAESALKSTANMAKRYLGETPLPASAVQLLHRAAAVVRLGTQSHLALHPENSRDALLDDEDVLVATSMMSGVPVAKLSTDDRARYANMVDFLHQRIIGQDEAVLALSRAVKTARVGLKDPSRPIGSFLFLGPTGVGKTELAKTLAEFMFDDENAMVVLDMSEYQQEHTVNRLIGAPPGYVGYESGGQLTDRVRQRPYTVVLFDEVEKAHARVLDVLLQVMEEGRLTDGQGRVASFSDTVLIMTSNLGSEFMDQPQFSEATRELVMLAVKQFFRPEFLNRLDEIILFTPLTPDQLRQILGLMIKKENKLLAEQGLQVEISEAAMTWLLAQNDHPEWGARPLRRIIRRFLREPLADYLLSASPPAGTVVRVDAGSAGLTFSPASR
jgi:ATP-dependent Clp protease ATP-binding subunit ClpC